jgi:hypothetical protein
MAQSSLDRALKNRGFGGLDDPAINQQLAFCVRDHEHFRAVLCGVKPEHRTMAYEAMRPYLRFEAKPLDVYMAEAADIAARKETEQTSIDVLASQAIERALKESKAKGSLLLVCARCLASGVFLAPDRGAATYDAIKQGWTRKDEELFCPKCLKPSRA